MKLPYVILGLALFSVSVNGLAADVGHGKKLYDAKCHGCHDTKIHTRPNRIIHTFDDLVGRVKFCDNASAANFSETDIMDVVEYLNKDFYKFVKGK